ncbi:hypothetical protein I8752_35790 [Nostocaceae cyanobacterium CENA369]|uniref:Uncharacterized protein n=1 Tax=Dendronalium phyllosphericum CENA369 TaxID=1725256 RepID=A0A8J7IDX4_9NOST|nr:hypothetical protein [Dendronalium phyllosphericum]MBH8578215.1 hypothetical protein [Dendronalium phyllosphericum CENA369]
MKRSPFVKIAMIVLLSLGSLGIVGGSFFLRKAFSSTSDSEIITDTSRYGEIRNHLWSDNNEVKHFPDKIPIGDQSVRIAYSPGFSQGGSYFQVRLKQPPDRLQKLLSQYRNIAQRKYRGGNTNDHANLPNGVPTTFFYTSDTRAESFPATYEILVLNAQDKGSPGFKWNHGDSYGVAIDSSASEIVYWAEKW